MTRKTTIAPLLSVRGGKKALEFYKAAFGAESLYKIEAPDGAVRRTACRRGSGVLRVPTNRPNMEISAGVTRHGAAADARLRADDSDGAGAGRRIRQSDAAGREK